MVWASPQTKKYKFIHHLLHYERCPEVRPSLQPEPPRGRVGPHVGLTPHRELQSLGGRRSRRSRRSRRRGRRGRGSRVVGRGRHRHYLIFFISRGNSCFSLFLSNFISRFFGQMWAVHLLSSFFTVSIHLFPRGRTDVAPSRETGREMIFASPLSFHVCGKATAVFLFPFPHLRLPVR